MKMIGKTFNYLETFIVENSSRALENAFSSVFQNLKINKTIYSILIQRVKRSVLSSFESKEKYEPKNFMTLALWLREINKYCQNLKHSDS